MKLKDSSVNVSDLHREMWHTLFELDMVWRGKVGYEMVITSGNDGIHTAPTSDHYADRAVDIRTWTSGSSGVQLFGDARDAAFAVVTEVLGRDWYVKNERTHFHLSYRPREAA